MLFFRPHFAAKKRRMLTNYNLPEHEMVAKGNRQERNDIKDRYPTSF